MIYHTELENFVDWFQTIVPDHLPALDGFDISGSTHPLKGVAGGDHIIYLDFSQRFDLDERIAKAASPSVARSLQLNKERAGVLISDVTGHSITDATRTLMLHHPFLLGAGYELTLHGQITPHLFEELNNRMLASSRESKFITMIYGEISGSGEFRYISAGHPPPLLYSGGSLTEVQGTSSLPLGMAVSPTADKDRLNSPFGLRSQYEVNSIQTRPGDILLLYTDGLSEHWDSEDGSSEFPTNLQYAMTRAAELSADGIQEGILTELRRTGPQKDDVSLVVIKNQGTD